MCCPFHGDKHPSMKVDSRFHCFACQADGDVIDFVGRLFQLSPYKAMEKLKEDFGMALADGKVRLAPRRPPTVRQQLLDYYRCLQRWRVRYAPQSPTEELHPCFLEAIKNLDIVEYYLDCSVLPDPQTENELGSIGRDCMSDWKKRNEDWRDEDELEEEEECECPWVDSKGKVRETAYCQYLLEKHPMMCLKQKLFDQNGEVDEDALLYEVHSDLRDFVLDNLAKKEKQVLDALRIETYTPEWKPQLDRIHLQNGTYFLDERGFVPEKELCLNRLPVEYQPDAPAPTKWLEFLDGLLIPEDILTLQEYLGYLLIPSTKAQKMLVMTGKGGEGKSRIGLLLKKLFGEASHSESILRIETNRFASANLEYKLVMVDDDLNMVALPETRNIKSIVTAEDRLCIERKNKQAVQGLLYVRFICFGNGNLVAAHDDSDGFWRRQILITVKDRDPARVDNPFLIEELSEERPGILLWMLEGLHRLLANRYQFTISERSIQNLEAAMADSDNLTQFMQATAYVRFKPDTEERSTYLYRAYTKWCEDNLESPVPQKKFSQFLLKNAGKYGLTFSKHIEGKYRGFRGVCVHPAFAAA